MQSGSFYSVFLKKEGIFLTVVIVIFIYALFINVLSLSLMAIDKKKALRRQWRIPERSLFGVALIGGSIGILLGSQLFRHKTQKNAFKYGIPLILTFQIILISFIIYYF